MNLRRYADAVSGGVLAVVGIVMLVETRNIRALRIMEFGPKIMPRIYSVALIVLGLAIALSGVLRALRDPSTEQSPNLGQVNFTKVMLTLALIGFYVGGLRLLGFLATSTVYLFLQVWVLGGAANKWRLLAYAAGAVAVSFGVYFLFSGAFDVFLPAGRIW
jgi:putative tricarboxylic transport membrane protein